MDDIWIKVKTTTAIQGKNIYRMELWFLNLIHSWMLFKIIKNKKTKGINVKWMNSFPNTHPPCHGGSWPTLPLLRGAKVDAPHHLQLRNCESRKDVLNELIRRYCLDHVGILYSITEWHSEKQPTYHQIEGELRHLAAGKSYWENVVQ